MISIKFFYGLISWGIKSDDEFFATLLIGVNLVTFKAMRTKKETFMVSNMSSVAQEWQDTKNSTSVNYTIHENVKANAGKVKLKESKKKKKTKIKTQSKQKEKG